MLPTMIMRQIASELAKKYPETRGAYTLLSGMIALVDAGASVIADREGIPYAEACAEAFNDWMDALHAGDTVWYESIVRKLMMNSIYGKLVQDTYPTSTDQPSTYQGETETTPVYQDTDSFCIYPDFLKGKSIELPED